MATDPWSFLKRDDLPTERLSLQDMVERFVAEVPQIKSDMDRMLSQYPDLRDRHGRLALPRIVSMWTLNFLCRAYGRPDLGYQPSEKRGPKP